MAYFSFSLLKKPEDYFSEPIQTNKKYYSKDITLWKHLNNINKQKEICILKKEIRLNSKIIGKKLLICLPPRFGLGDAVEYSIALRSLIESKKFTKVGLAYCGNYEYIFNKLFLFPNIYPLFISEEEIRNYDTIFHITLGIEALKFQKYYRSDIVAEICKYFNIKIFDFKITKKNLAKTNQKTITIFPISTSVIRSLPFKVIFELIQYFKNEYRVKIIIDDSTISKNLEKQNIKKYNFEFIKPKNIEELIIEISKISFGIFVDSGPLHLAKIFDKRGLLIETSVKNDILLSNSNKIFALKNTYFSNYCSGPCGLVDIFSNNNNVGCYETNKISFEEVRKIENLKKLQRFNKSENNTHFSLNPVGCIKNIAVNNIIELIKVKIKEE